MANVPSDLKYTEEHEWARREGDLVVVGITDYAQDTLGDVVYVEFSTVGERVEAGEPFGVVESVKAASDLYAPVSGEVAEVNETLFDAPELINSDPYGEAWLIKIRSGEGSDWDDLLDAEAYKALLD
ncbi:MAG: glycine cleavage system protein GcvH [Chloroflexota bacterium]|nr:glycine cleavage system protein GcvH [Chloroflexota bacterium]